MKGDKMECFKKILGLLIISTLVMTAFAQQSPGTNREKPVNESDLWIGRTHYEDDLVFDNAGGTSEPEILTRTNPAGPNADRSSTLPKEYRLFENYPNPFNPSTTIKFSIPEKGFVTLAVYDAAGREVSTLVSSQINAGTHELSFNASGLASGLYFYKIAVNNFTDVKKMILIK